VAFGLITAGPADDSAFQANGQPGVQVKAGGGQQCPKIYAPVICDNGKTYPNQCVADRHHAQNCVPTGDI